jgi:alanyl-tRNA synthetase
VGGKGGGRPDLAQAGGKLVAKLPEALETARQQIQTLLSG